MDGLTLREERAKRQRQIEASDCELCGIYKAIKEVNIPLWNFGVRSLQLKKICKKCLSALNKGEL